MFNNRDYDGAGTHFFNIEFLQLLQSMNTV